jgi:hypothetical protein
VSLVGDWDKVVRRIESLSDDLKKEIGQSTAVSLQQIEKAAVGHIDKQDLPLAPLSPAYARYKARTRNASWRRRRGRAGKDSPRRLSEKTLVATGAFRQSITSYQLSPFEGEVGVSRQESYSGGEKIADIGTMLSTGTSKMPARDIWQPTADEMAEKVTNNFVRAARKVLNA